MTEQEQRKRIGMRQPVDTASDDVRNLYTDRSLEDLLLEEVLLRGTPDREEWDVTIGFARPYTTERSGALCNVLPQAKPRAYKRFLIDADTGEVQGMIDDRIDAD